MFIAVTHCTTTSKESACRIICMLCQQTSPKRWFANLNKTSYCDVTNTVFPVTMTTTRHCSIPEFGRGASNQAVAPLNATVLLDYFLKANAFYATHIDVWLHWIPSMDELFVLSDFTGRFFDTVCRYTAHERCVNRVPANCIQTYVKSAKDSTVRWAEMRRWGGFRFRLCEVQDKLKDIQLLLCFKCNLCRVAGTSVGQGGQ